MEGEAAVYVGKRIPAPGETSALASLHSAMSRLFRDGAPGLFEHRSAGPPGAPGTSYFAGCRVDWSRSTGFGLECHDAVDAASAALRGGDRAAFDGLPFEVLPASGGAWSAAPGPAPPAPGRERRRGGIRRAAEGAAAVERE